MRGPSDGLMIPIPQYPLYTATMALLNATAVKYFMDEDGKWTLNVSARNIFLYMHIPHI